MALLDILPMVHRAKGEAGLLGFNLFEEKLHALEDVIDELRKRPQVQGEDLLSLTVQLDRLMLDVKSIYALLEHMSDLRQTFASEESQGLTPVTNSSAPTSSFNPPTESGADEQNMLAGLRQMVQAMAAVQGKRVEFFAEGFDVLLLTSYQRNQLRDILLQLMRNAVTHGIELPDERLASGKAEIGQIRLQAQIQAQGCSIICYDDGRGIDASKLRDAALIGGYANEDDLLDCDEQNLYALMFETGLSTAEEVTVHSGRGVGLDVVKQQIKALGGQLALATELGQFCAWRISLPYTHLEHLPFAAV
ncbi:ATP-binding protein [Methylocucumis oryzae]|uniref:Chemotaxis protein CheA n=1 Tax=Methylocucumis oryzae TaxID=1632867 RepID=A0A0F3IIW9_9GAMM|nr:ATP-binding protein [Methylocucumis oryzae]KJV06681.1 hypothetical protein VZ94_09780 [Methylocucumis oryzae]